MIANSRHSQDISGDETKQSMAGIRYRPPHFATGSPLLGLVTGMGPGGSSNIERQSKNPRLAQYGANLRRGGPPNKPKDTTTTAKAQQPSKGGRWNGGQPRDDRLWDPSKGTRAAQVNHATSHTAKSPVGGEVNSTRVTPTERLGRSKKTTYLVTDPCDPDSFDRGGVVQVSYETNRQAKQYNKTVPAAPEKKGKRNRGRRGNRGHLQQPFHDTPVDIEEESDILLIQDYSPALKAFVSNTDDKILGRFAFGSESGVYCSTESLDAMMARLTLKTPAFCVSGTIGAGYEADIGMDLAGVGSQFEKSDDGMD